MQAHPPGRPVWHRARQPLPGLHRDLAGRVQQFGQVIDRPAQPAPAPPGGAVPQPGRGQRRRLRLRAAQRPPRAGQQPARIGCGLLGKLGELPGAPRHRGLLVVPGLRGP
jgi:hypothetical protein